MNKSLSSLDVRIPLIRFLLAVIFMMAGTLLLVGVQFLFSGRGPLAALATVADIQPTNQTLLAVVSGVAGLIFLAMSGRAWWAFEQWLASTNRSRDSRKQ